MTSLQAPHAPPPPPRAAGRALSWRGARGPQRCSVSVLPAREATGSLRAAVSDWDAWLAAGAGAGAGAGRRALAAQSAWLPIKGRIVRGDVAAAEEEEEDDAALLPAQASERVVRGTGVGQTRAVRVQLDGGDTIVSTAVWG